jgi:hypothetical protein
VDSLLPRRPVGHGELFEAETAIKVTKVVRMEEEAVIVEKDM